MWEKSVKLDKQSLQELGESIRLKDTKKAPVERRGRKHEIRSLHSADVHAVLGALGELNGSLDSSQSRRMAASRLSGRLVLHVTKNAWGAETS